MQKTQVRESTYKQEVFFPLKIFFLFFNWWKSALQFCVCFCCTTIQISHHYIFINIYYVYSPSLLNPPPFPPSHPSRSSQAGLPVLFSNFPLSVLHMLMLLWLLYCVLLCNCYKFFPWDYQEVYTNYLKIITPYFKLLQLQ